MSFHNLISLGSLARRLSLLAKSRATIISLPPCYLSVVGASRSPGGTSLWGLVSLATPLMAFLGPWAHHPPGCRRGAVARRCHGGGDGCDGTPCA